MDMSRKDFQLNVERQLSFYGIAHRFTAAEYDTLFERGCSVASAYDIASDIANGFTFEEAFKAEQMELLQRSALESCHWRGHKMQSFVKVSGRENETVSRCRDCEGVVYCNTKPMPNEIDICGDAVALDCPVEEKREKLS